jgi:hypothetical protein
MANINENAASSASQNKVIAAWLQNGNSLTSLEALKRFGCMRLASRICDLRQKFNMAIECRKIVTATGKRVAEYRLAQ